MIHKSLGNKKTKELNKAKNLCPKKMKQTFIKVVRRSLARQKIFPEIYLTIFSKIYTLHKELKLFSRKNRSK